MSRIKSAAFGDVFRVYLTYAEDRLKSAGEIRRLYQRYLTHLDSRSLSGITRFELQMLHSDIGNRSGKTAANRAIELVSVVFNKAVDWELYEGQNPCSRIQKFRLNSRERFLTPSEVDRFFSALEKCRNRHMKALIYLCIYTGARSGNVMSMRWTDIDFGESVWTIPDSKNGEPYKVPLIPQAIDLLKSCPRTSVFVFPSPSGGHVVNPRKTWYKILDDAGISGLRMHDLRRSLGSWQARTGASLSIIGKTLNHRDPKSTSIYARLDLSPVRSAMITAIEAMQSARSA